MAVERQRQIALSATEAWVKLEKVLSRPIKGRKVQTQVNDAKNILRESPDNAKRKKYQGFLFEVLRRCGPGLVVLCAIGLGQAQIANMNVLNRSSLLGILEKKKGLPLVENLNGVVPNELKDIYVASHPRPTERNRDQYHIYKFATMDMTVFSRYFPPRLLQFMDDRALRAWEMRKSSTGTETVRTDVPWSAFEDCLMFLEVGSAQDVIAELFPPGQRIPSPSCCPDHYFLRGASTEALSAFFGAYIFQAIDESELRKWEKENRQSETTDCVEIQLLRDPTSRHGILKVRIGWRLGNPLVNSLYA
ncbi:hypothetical protein AG0111_0g12097 [Alternaria gaisen]|uniref:Uncharacterized protein n=1 Tax=Alternaria gaisen TaxID=167740 RepID=A0ACB6F589_9PLEO|nr:hypothetical protein AG0111_0g12097 [Alternaria gaisen]